MTELNPDTWTILLPNGLTEDVFPAYFDDSVEDVGSGHIAEVRDGTMFIDDDSLPAECRADNEMGYDHEKTAEYFEQFGQLWFFDPLLNELRCWAAQRETIEYEVAEDFAECFDAHGVEWESAASIPDAKRATEDMDGNLVAIDDAGQVVAPLQPTWSGKTCVHW